ncbi:hypothetical protein ACPYO6_08700 [Georgenia sp. Z1344]|uniref:hypothetical protein n=1 Tax=Georgenia sp. Z1344 TaxID=3416706 RepID=UPI003CEE5EC6
MTGRRRRVIALSAADRRRLAEGDLVRPEDAFDAPEPVEDTAAADAPVSSSGPPSAADQRLLREVPPHFGRL